MVLLCVLCLAVSAVLPSSPAKSKKAGDSKRVYLIHADELTYDRWRNNGAQVLRGHVQFEHDGARLYCDSANYFEPSNSFEAWGDVKMVQGDTLSLTGDYGYYDGNEKTLEAINRRMNLERLEQVVSKIRAGRNIHQHLDLIAGLPYEDYESFGRSFNRVYAMRPDQLQLGFLKVLNGTPIFDQAEESGIVYSKQPPYEVLYTKWLPYRDVVRLKKIEEMVELYYNSNQFVNTLTQLVKAFDSPFAMFEALAEYYENHQLFTNSPSRVYRYEVLLNFATEKNGKKEFYTDLMTYDLYLRENMKSRPDFCRSIFDEVYKKFKHDFYKEEEASRHYLADLGVYDARQLAGMTHLERFEYPVWDGERLNPEEKDPGYLLFDYSKRDPLTKEARTVRVP